MRDEIGATGGRDAERWLAAIAAKQDRAAFAALFGFYAPRIKTMLMRNGAAADTAEDIAQETLLTVWRKAAHYDPRPGERCSLGLYHRTKFAHRSATPRQTRYTLCKRDPG